MLINMLVLGSILYVGFKNFQKQRQLEKSKKPVFTQATQARSMMTEKLTQIFTESSHQNIQQNASEPSSALTFQEQNKRQIVSALVAMMFSVAGLWLYRPLGFLTLPFVLYASKQYHKETYVLIKQGKASVETLMTISIIGSLTRGYFFIASFITLVIGLAMRISIQVTQNSRQQLVSTFEQQPDFVCILVKDIEVNIPFNELQKSDIVIVCTGEMISVDGTVIEGIASVDQHILTGEARPVDKEPGDDVFASSVVLSGKIFVKVQQMGQESTVAKITHILNTTVDFKSTTQLRADALSRQLVNPTLIAGSLALPILGFGGALAVVNAHPKNRMMGIAPIIILNYFKLASRQGILIKDGRSLELLNQVDTIVFDKTGTLTEEQPHIGRIHCYSDYSENDILVYASAAEYKQKHPLAKAILQEAENRQLTIPSIEDSEYKVGYGIIVNVTGQTVHVGSERFMEVENIMKPPMFTEQQKLCHEEGYNLVVVAIDKQIVGAIELQPTVRPEAKAVINRLKQRPNIKATYIISGDNEIPTKKLANALGIDHYFAETLPEDKATLIEQLQQEGRFICYIGDGINDSIAMKKSHVSVSLTGASTIATDTAQIVLMNNGINQLDLLFDLAHDFNTNMNRMFFITIIPAIIGVSGAFLFGFSIAQTAVLNAISIFFSIGSAMTPLLKQPENTPKLFLPPSNKKNEK